MERNKYACKKEVLSMEEIREEMIAQYLSIFIQDNHMANSFSMYRYLRFIIISHSNISKMPTDFGTLPHLEHLDLSDNILGKNNDDYNWLWLTQTAIKNNLLFLNLSKNLLTELPLPITKLNMLLILQIRHNNLTYLPQDIINLKSLIILDVSNNNLAYLPVIICKRRLYINVTMNPFLGDSTDYYFYNLKTVLSLVELLVRKTINQKIAYDKVIPRTLIGYLDKVMKYCSFCDTPCIYSYIKWLTQVPSKHIMAASVEKSDNVVLLFEHYFCSKNCFWKIVAEYFEY